MSDYESTTKMFCGFKTAYFVDQDHDGIADMIAEDRFFEAMAEVELPEGWEFRGTDSSGAAGFVVRFDINKLPTEYDMADIANIMDTLEKDEQTRQWNANNIFNVDTFEEYVIYSYQMTDEMVSCALDLWNAGNRDYSKIAEALSVDSVLSADTSQWSPAMIGKTVEEKLAMGEG